MNLKQVIATGTVGAMLGLGSTVASAQEGSSYFAVFYGASSIDISRDDLNALASRETVSNGGTAPSGSSELNDGDTIWGVQAGYRFNRFVGAEVGYVDLGKAHYQASLVSNFGGGAQSYQMRGRFLSSGPTVAIVGFLPIKDLFDIYGRGGIYFADTRLRLQSDFADASPQDDISEENKAGTQELFGGLGFAWNINADFALRTEISYFLDVGDDDRTGEASVTTLTVGVGFR